MKPDYIYQVQEVYRNLATQAQVTREGWKDNVGKRFYRQYVDRYKEDTDFYIREFDHTLRVFDKCQNDMSALCGVDMSSAESPSLHDSYLNRKDWSEYSYGKNPGNLNASEAKAIMNERERK